MKNIFKEQKIYIACVGLLLVMLLAGCDLLKPPIEYCIVYGRTHIKISHGTAWIEEHDVTIKLVVGDEKNEPIRKIELSEMPVMLTASGKYIYLLSASDNASKYSLVKYDYSLKKKAEYEVPYSQVTYRNGYLFGYLEERVPDTVDLLASEMPDYLVATHYVKEKDMEKKWKKIKDKEIVRLDGITLYRQWKDPEWYNNCYFSDTKPIPDYLGSTQDLICKDGDWQTLGREKQSAFFVKHKKELDKIIGNCKYGRLVFNKCGNDIYGIFNEYDDTDSANGFAYGDLKRGVIIRYSGETNKITKVREMKDGQQLMSATAQYVIYRQDKQVRISTLSGEKDRCLHDGENEGSVLCTEDAYFWRDIKMTAVETDKANTKWENYFD